MNYAYKNSTQITCTRSYVIMFDFSRCWVNIYNNHVLTYLLCKCESGGNITKGKSSPFKVVYFPLISEICTLHKAHGVHKFTGGFKAKKY